MAPELRLTEFSGGYYSVEMDIQPHPNGPLVEASLDSFIRDTLYSDVDADPIFKLQLNGGRHFTPTSHHSIPPETLALPEAWITDAGFSTDGSTERVYIVKQDQSRFLESFGGELST